MLCPALEIYVYVRVNHKKYVKIFLCKWWRSNEKGSGLMRRHKLCPGRLLLWLLFCCFWPGI